MPTDFRLVVDRYTVTEVLVRLGVHVKGDGTCRCPFHDDKTASGSVYTAKDGRERYKCFSDGCGVSGDSLDLAKASLGTTDHRTALDWLTGGESPPMPPRERRVRTNRKPELVFDLTAIPPERLDEIRAGAETPGILHKRGLRKTYKPQMVHRYGSALLVLRIERGDGGKLPLPLRWCRQNGWVSVGWQDDERRLLYHEDELARRPEAPVLVVEGEKCVDLLKPLPAFEDLVVITWGGGTQAIRKHDWSALQGRNVILWPDADKSTDGQEHGPGLRAMLWLADTCAAARRRILWPLEAWLDRDIGYDAADLLEECHHNGAVARRTMNELLQEHRPPEPPPEPPQNPDEEPIAWVCKAQMNNGRVERVPDPRDENNLWLWISQLAPEQGGYRGRFSRDVFTGEVRLDGRVIDAEVLVHQVSYDIARHEFLRAVTPHRVRERIGAVADLVLVNPLADELRALAWDNQPRHLLGYAGASVAGPEGRWARVAGHRWLVGLVRRILTPGWQHDGVLVLESKQGTGKSSFFRGVGHILGRDLHVELDRLTREPDVQMQLRGKCVVELAEMAAGKKDEDALKGMLTSTKDVYRRPYGRAPEEVNRTCVFCGTTNAQNYLKDITGNRRYWIVATPDQPDLAALEQDLPQLLAQTLWIIERGEPEQRQNWLTAEEAGMQETMAASREQEWPQFDGLDAWLEKRPSGFLTRSEVWEGCGFQNTPQRQSWLVPVLKKLMAERGWVEARDRNIRGFRKRDSDVP